VSEKHHNIFGENGTLLVCPASSECFVCQEIIGDVTYHNWFDSVKTISFEFCHYLRFSLDLDGLVNTTISEMFSESILDGVSKLSEPSYRFFSTQNFGLVGYYHPSTESFLSSCFTFEVWSLNPFPDNSIRELYSHFKFNYYYTECEFSHGSFQVRNENVFRSRLKEIRRRSLGLLGADDMPDIKRNSSYMGVISGITPISFSLEKVSNIFLEGKIQVIS
jgi:hypothetical protein